MKILKKTYYMTGVAMTLGMTGTSSAWATGTGTLGAQSITDNLATSISNLPKLISSAGFLAGLVLATLGVLKIKDHVENPQQTPLKEGAIRLAIGGALVSMPAIFSALVDVFGSGTNTAYDAHANLSQSS